MSLLEKGRRSWTPPHVPSTEEDRVPSTNEVVLREALMTLPEERTHEQNQIVAAYHARIDDEGESLNAGATI